MVNLNVVAKFNKKNANTFQVLSNEVTEALGWKETKLFGLII